MTRAYSDPKRVKGDDGAMRSETPKVKGSHVADTAVPTQSTAAADVIRKSEPMDTWPLMPGARGLRRAVVAAHIQIDALRAQNADLLAALRQIADTPCDHGPGFCPRDVARAAISKAEGRS